jgi:hypothetical protein
MTFLRPTRLRALYRDLRVSRRERLPEPVIVVEGTSAAGIVDRLYFSEETGLILRRTNTVETPLGSLPQQYDFGDYRVIDRVQIPMRIVWSRAAYQVTFVFAHVEHK